MLSRLTAFRGVGGVIWRDQAKKKKRERTHLHGQQCSDKGAEEGGWWLEVEQGMGG